MMHPKGEKIEERSYPDTPAHNMGYYDNSSPYAVYI
jgi:hypothetical protein